MDPAAYLPLNEALNEPRGPYRLRLENTKHLGGWQYAYFAGRLGLSWSRINGDLYFVAGNPEENKYGVLAMGPGVRGEQLVADARFDTFAEAYQYLKMIEAAGGM